MLLPALSFLGVLMVIDYVSGMLAAKKESFENPNDSRFGWSSKRSILGIYKKLGYILTIFVAVSSTSNTICEQKSVPSRFAVPSFCSPLK